jgi:multidrug efflux pump subunit AcrB
MSADEFDPEIERLFARSPQMADSALFLAQVEQKLQKGSQVRFLALSLAGVIVSHIIVLSDFIEEERAAGVALEEALTRAALVRLRAVLATVFATVCGLIPLALTGGELWRPLTAVHLFGLLFGTLLTLLLLPVLYLLFARWRLIR